MLTAEHLDVKAHLLRLEHLVRTETRIQPFFERVDEVRSKFEHDETIISQTQDLSIRVTDFNQYMAFDHSPIHYVTMVVDGKFLFGEESRAI